jgi:glycosyltransferase involved in cell wall biosynthesis
MRLIFIGRLDTYKRLDWLLLALSELRSPWRLVVVGDGPLRASFEAQANRLVFAADGLVSFRGRLDEAAKRQCLAEAELLVLPSDRSNEAFGIVQLEAMAAGLPALAFQRPRSGMGWVGQLPGLQWSQQPEDLQAVLQRLADHPEQRERLGQQSRQRYQELFARSVWLECLEALG